MTPPRPAPGLPGLASPLGDAPAARLAPAPGIRRSAEKEGEAEGCLPHSKPPPELRLSAVPSGAGLARLPRPGVTSAAAAQSPLQPNN